MAADGSTVRLSRLIALVGVLFGLLSPSLPAHAFSEDPWVFEGGGWGHGVGLSQFGALGQAEEGKSPIEILKFYYGSNSFVDDLAGHWTDEAEGLHVGLVSNTPSVTIGAVGEGEVRICHPSSDCSLVNEVVTTTDTWHFEVISTNPTKCRVRRGSGETGEHWASGGCDAKVTQPADTATRIVVDGTEYAHGTLHMTPSSGGFHAVLKVELEKYLYGLAEVPSDWHAWALQTQAIIGRTFAVLKAEERDGSAFWADECGCHIRDTTLDQAFTGWSKEDPAKGGDDWKQAVDDTEGQVVKHPESKVALSLVETFYSSSNGGASEDNEDVWGGTPRPYLRSVVDPWSADPDVNPLATWTVSVSDEDMAEALGWDRVLDAFFLEGPPGLIVEFTGVNNGTNVEKTLNGTQIASLLKAYGFGYFAPGSPINKTVRVSPYISGVIDPPGFDDIAGHLFEADIEWAAEVGITKGCNPPANTLFCPDDPVSREVMAAFLNRALDLPPASKDHFTDDDSSIFEDDINRIAEAGITKGCNPPDNDRFCPKLAVDRGAMAAFLVRALGLTDGGGDDLFTDDNNSIFEIDIDKLGTAGITKGCNPPVNSWYCPKLLVDRGAMAAFLHRALGE